MCVIGGDATQVLPQRIPSSSLDYLFINHPEPPQQTGGLDSQGKHLLTMVSERSVIGVMHPPHLPLFPYIPLHSKWFSSHLLLYSFIFNLFQDFFGELCRVLKPAGMITIVTDNIWYLRFMPCLNYLQLTLYYPVLSFHYAVYSNLCTTPLYY